jgi:proteasome lid subunit RPN8/RPN11
MVDSGQTLPNMPHMAGQRLAFSPPVQFSEHAVREMCRLARKGYEVPGKQEVFGFLYGIRNGDSRLLVRHARYYRGGKRTRYGIDIPIDDSRRRRRALTRQLGQRYLGSFHSHVEIGGWNARGLSPADLESFRSDHGSALEVIVNVWAGTPRSLRAVPKTVFAFEPETGYHYRIRAYAKLRNGIRRARIRVLRSRAVIIY